MKQSKYIDIETLSNKWQCTIYVVLQAVFEGSLSCHVYMPGGVHSKCSDDADMVDLYIAPASTALTPLDNPTRWSCPPVNTNVQIRSGGYLYAPEDLWFSSAEVEAKDGKKFQAADVESASAALKALQTADIDKQIDDVKQVIEAAVRDHIRGRKPERVINHILFLKEVGLSSSDRAKTRIKAFIEKDFSFYEYSTISRRPAAKDGYFVNS